MIITHNTKFTPKNSMKKYVFIAICSFGLLCFSSCKSTKSPCGLADNTTNQTKRLQSANYTLEVNLKV